MTRILVFGTSYVDSASKRFVVQQWANLNSSLSPDCDLMLVDSASTHPLPSGVRVAQLGDNIGHLARGGQDGWGRAFCVGLQLGLEWDYDWVVHVESDSLLRHSVRAIVDDLRTKRHSRGCASVPVGGTRRPEKNWIETGLMFFEAEYLRRSNLIARYNWRDCEPKRRYPHCPEWWVHGIVHPEMYLLPLNAERGDLGQITADNVDGYDWVTHVGPDVASAFVRSCDSAIHR